MLNLILCSIFLKLDQRRGRSISSLRPSLSIHRSLADFCNSLWKLRLTVHEALGEDNTCLFVEALLRTRGADLTWEFITLVGFMYSRRGI